MYSVAVDKGKGCRGSELVATYLALGETDSDNTQVLWVGEEAAFDDIRVHCVGISFTATRSSLFFEGFRWFPVLVSLFPYFSSFSFPIPKRGLAKRPRQSGKKACE